MKRPQQQSKIMQRRQLRAQARKRVKHPQVSDTVLTPTQQQQQQAETQQGRQLHEKKRQQARKKRMEKKMKKSWPSFEKEK